MAQPIAKFAAGAISAAIFENEAVMNGRTVTIPKVTVQRRYKDRSSGEWKSTQSYARNDVPLLILCLVRAFAKMCETQSEEQDNSNAEEEVVM